MFADVSGFTKLSERLAEQGKAGAEELTAILNDRFTDLLSESFDEGGDLLKYGGDALLLLFRGDGHADRACRAAHRMREALRARGPITTGRGRVILRVSQGVHSGRFACFLAGTAQRELILAGHEASEVTEMETVAEAGDILVSPATAALLPEHCLGAVKGPGRLLRRRPSPRPVPDAGPPADAEGDDPAVFVPRPVRARIEAGIEEAEHRYATVGFLHVFGLDDLVARLPADTVLARLHHLVDVVEEAASESGLCLISSDIAHDGTKLILTAGAPDAVEDGEGAMLSVLRHVLDRVDDLSLHAGVNGGHVFAGDVGAPFRRVYTVIGDAVNLAARLMAKAAPGQLLVHAPTLADSGVSFVTEPLPPFFVKGKSKPIEALSVGTRLGLREAGQALPAPFVGRDLEVATLDRLVDDAGQRHGACAYLVGPGGVGKSRLVEAVLARHPDLVVTRVTCEPSLAERPYFVARLITRRMLGIDLDADAIEAGRQLTDVVSRSVPAQRPYLPLLATVVDAEVAATAESEQVRPEHRPRMVAEAVAAVFDALVTDPRALVIEGADWMDEPSAGVLARVLQPVADRPWFVCLTSRGGRGGLSDAAGFPTTRLELGPLPSDTAHQLASQLVTDSAVPAHDVDLLVARSGGNPLFLIELVAARLAAGSVDAVPSSLEDLVTSRIDRLSPADRRALRYVSVLGSRFDPRLAATAFRDVLPGVDDPALWDRLEEFLVPERRGDRRFAFDLVRTVAYEGLPYLRRRELHERVGLAIEGSASVHSDDRSSLLSLHFAEAHDLSRAWRYSREAGARALAKYANLEAATFLERALASGRAGHTAPDGEVAEIAEQLGDALAVTGSYERAAASLRLARSLRTGDPRSTARILRKEGVVRERQGRYAAALGWYRRALRDAEQLGDVERAHETAELAVAYAGVRYRQGKPQDCARWCRRALEQARAGGNRRAEAHAYYLLDAALTDLGDPEAAAVRGLALPIFEELGDLHGQSNVLNNLGVDALYDGHWDEAARYWEQCRRVRERSGDVVGIADVCHNLGEVRSDQGRFEEAESLMREARRIWRAAQYPLGVAASTSGLGRLAARAGSVDEGLTMLDEAVAGFRALQASVWTWETELRRAEALATGRRWEEAVAHVDAVLSEHDLAKSPPLLALALRVRGVARDGLGDRAGALADLDEAVAVAASSAVYEEALARHERAGRHPDPAVADADRDRAETLFAQLGVGASVAPAPTLAAHG